MTQSPEEPIDIQRVLMDRAKRMAERDLEPQERPLLPRLVGIGLALIVVVVVLFARADSRAREAAVAMIPAGCHRAAAGCDSADRSAASSAAGSTGLRNIARTPAASSSGRARPSP